MIKYWDFHKCIEEKENGSGNCWIQVMSPTPEDIDHLVREYNVPEYFLSDIADADERARYDADEGWHLIILRIPHSRKAKSRAPYITMPLGIILNGEKIITVCYDDTSMMIDFINHQRKRACGFIDGVDMVFRLFLSASVWYLQFLKLIGSHIEHAKYRLDDKKIDNRDLINLSRLQDSLTYFATAIRDNETLLTRLKYKLSVDELDAELIEDVNVEISQARETTSIYIDILNSTMETNANIINNDMNTVMRLLTSLNMIIMFPTLIASIFGMNLINGMEEWEWGFPFALLICAVTIGLSYWWFKRKNWL